MLTREECKAIVDKVLNMAKADGVEVNLTAGERSGTRWANSTITTNLVQYDRQVTVTLRVGQKTGTASTRDFSDAGFQKMIDEANAEAQKATDVPNLPELIGAQEYIPVDATLPAMLKVGPLERGRMVKDSIDASVKLGVLGAGFIPQSDIATCNANSKGLFAYYRAAEIGFSLTCRMRQRLGVGGHHGTQRSLDARREGAHRSRVEQSAQESQSESDRAGSLHRDSRAARECAIPLAAHGHLQSESRWIRWRWWWFPTRSWRTPSRC
jgi:predicted Zn-dependent protease